MDFGYKPTTNGRELLAACMAVEKPLHLTRVAMGSGMVPEGTNLADVHKLYEYVTEGAISERKHENDRLYLTVQYANNEHPEQEVFYLSEFIIYAQHPVTGAETDLLYATLGDYRQAVPAYSANFPASIFNYPLVLIVSDEIDITINTAPGIVTHDDLQRLLNEGVIGISRSDIIIPAEGWTDKDPEIINYPFHVDIPIAGVKSRMMPMLTINPEHADRTEDLCPCTETIDEALRVYAKRPPTAEIGASLALIGGSGHIGTGSDGEITIPVATKTTLGGIIPGDDFEIGTDGRLSVNKDKVITTDDLADESAVQKDVIDILNS